MVKRVLIRGAGDIGSTVAHRLFCAGYMVAIHEQSQPTTTRRRMAFADAVFDGRTELVNVVAVCTDDLSALLEGLASRTSTPIFVGDFQTLLHGVQCDVLIDARMRKRN